MEFLRYGRRNNVMNVPLTISNFGESHEELFSKAAVSGYELWSVYSQNNFDNQFAKTDYALYKKKGLFSEAVRDMVFSNNVRRNNMISVTYISAVGTDREKKIETLSPPEGWYVPTEDGLFVPDTLIPFETMSIRDKDEALKLFEAKGLPGNQLSYFVGLNTYTQGYAGRIFDLSDKNHPGRFNISNLWGSGPGWNSVGTRSAKK